MGVEIAILAIGAAISAYSAIQQGEAQKDQADAQAQQAVNEGAYRADAAKAQAEKIRRAGRAKRGEARAALTASGVKLGEGTPLEVDKTIAVRSEEDALSAILSGTRARNSANEEATLITKRGESAQTSGYFSAAGTALGAASKVSRGGWSATVKNDNLDFGNAYGAVEG